MALYNRKFTPKVQEIIVNALKNGLSNAAAAGLACISEQTFYNWYNEGAKKKTGKMKEFHDAVDNARDVAQANYENVIATAANDGTWQAAAWWLERRRHNIYGKKEHHQVDMESNQKIHLKGKLTTEQVLIDNEDTIREFINRTTNKDNK